VSSGVMANPAPQRMPWLNLKLLVAGVVILMAVGYLIYMGMQSTTTAYFVTVGELEQNAAKVDGQTVRVGGDVQAGSIVRGGVGDPLQFTVTDGMSSIPVVYKGVAPDIFSDHTQVVIEGTYHANGTFQADTLLTKCPSRFESAPTGGTV
jgi:cytochrome c-type biogenesis protein CcmE